jgi:hypothetical protein
MATGLGIAAGAFAQNYANAMGLRSRLDSEKQQQEANEIRLQRERDFNASQKELADLHKQFLDKDFDFVSGKPYEQPQGGITPPGQQRPTDPYTDSARVKSYYDRITPVLERQAYASGKDFLGVRKAVDDLRKGQFVERVGSAISMIEAGDNAGIKQLQAVYDMYPDGRSITGGKINEDGSVLLQYTQNGQAGERTITRDQLRQYGQLALNPADAAKLRFQMFENQKDREFKSGEAGKDRDFRSTEAGKDRDFRSGEGQKDRDFRSTEGEKDRTFRTGEREATQNYELPFKQGALGVSRQNADSARISANASAENARTNAEIKRDTLDTNRVVRQTAAEAKAERDAQKFFDSSFGTSDFKVKTDDEVKALLPKQKKAYEEARAKQGERMARRNAATGLWDLNGRKLSPSFITSALPIIEKRVMSDKPADGTDAETGLPYVNINGKKVLLPKD